SPFPFRWRRIVILVKPRGCSDARSPSSSIVKVVSSTRDFCKIKTTSMPIHPPSPNKTNSIGDAPKPRPPASTAAPAILSRPELPSASNPKYPSHFKLALIIIPPYLYSYKYTCISKNAAPAVCVGPFKHCIRLPSLNKHDSQVRRFTPAR